jgi:peptidoglycan/xylan/chitin deacetylase (PgdA/CDA1 family)
LDTKKVKETLKSTLIGLCGSIENKPRRYDDAIVTLYHEVGDIISDYSIANSVFEGQLQYLFDNRVTWYTATELSKNLKQGQLSNTMCATFDDGTVSAYQAAIKMIEAGAGCTHFIVPGRIQSSWKNTITWAQVRELDDLGVEIGSHSMTHPHLTSLGQEELVREVRASKAVLEDKLGKPVTSFAYPYGEFDNRVRQAVIESNYQCAYTTRHFYASRTTDLYRIPRFEPLKSVQILADLCAGKAHQFYRLLEHSINLRDTLAK